MRFLILFIFFVFLPLRATAEEGWVSSEGSLALEVDACSFRGDDGPYEEVVIRFPAAHLAFDAQGDSLFVARYVPRLELFDEDGNSVKRIEGERVFSSAERIDDPEHFVYDIARFQVPVGYYHAVLEVKAVGNDRQGRAVFPLWCPSIRRGGSYLAICQREFPTYREDAKFFKRWTEMGQARRCVYPLWRTRACE